MKSIITVVVLILLPLTSSLAKDVIVISLRGSSAGSTNMHTAVQVCAKEVGYTLKLGSNWRKSEGPGVIGDNRTEDLRDLINSLAAANGGDKSELGLLVAGKSAGGILAWNTFRKYFNDISGFHRAALVMVDPHGAVTGDGKSGTYCDTQKLWWPGHWSTDTDFFRVYNVYQQRKILTGASFPDSRVYENVKIAHGSIDHGNIPDDGITRGVIKEAFHFVRDDTTWLVPVTWLNLN